jgi:hypothetical protein
MDARESGMSPDEAAEAAGRYMAEVKPRRSGLGLTRAAGGARAID